MTVLEAYAIRLPVYPRTSPGMGNERCNALTIDGDATRWVGVVLFAAGGALRLY